MSQSSPAVPAEIASASGVLDSVAARLGAGASVSAVYGDPVECEGVTVIPVARTGYRFDGAANRGRARGRAWAAPAGYIRVKDGEAHFTPIRPPVKSLVVPLVLPLALIGCCTAAGIVRMVTRR
ncbi:hypothetical protein [Nocardiopsis ansamitocini]|uniref:Sporulation protein YtfJ n=1 Tax=Nocardiopsis ansamitocini TaxID=1670832 RepID=A0A9W6UHN5_9ACTN|nr:hypothetical protein [Nocardiopsis ansamitocini]GLU46548.1 hypothetical protein Nans01_08990 [Nocardiopsis ansamitocini]